jgi:hypothetical protein
VRPKPVGNVPEPRPARPQHVPIKAQLTLLAVATVLVRLPLLTPRLAHWDAVNYALGLHDFNVAAHQPHPPGSPYYILLGRVALALVGGTDDNAALILVSLAASVGAVLGEYALARLVFGHRTGFLAALVLLSQPVFWGYGTMGMPWTLLACLAVAIGLTCALLVRGLRRLVFPSALLVGLASGFRLEVTAFLAPLWVWAVWTAEPRPRRRLAAMALVAVCVLVWLVPVAATSGGLTTWSERMLAMFVPPDTSTGPVARQLASNTAISFGTLAFSLGPAVVLALASDWRASLRVLRTTLHMRRSGVFWTLWIVPAFVFMWLFDSTEPGHALVFSVALCVLGAGLLVATARDTVRLIVCGTLLVGAQTVVFLFAAPQFDRPLAWTANAMLLNVTAPGLRQHQASLDDALQTIRARFDTGETAILTVTGQDAYRFMMYYLPEYAVLRLDPQAQSVLTARGRQHGTWHQPADCLFETGGVRHAVWVLAARSEPGVVPEGATRVSSATEGPFTVWEVRPGPDTPDYLGFKIGGTCAQ